MKLLNGLKMFAVGLGTCIGLGGLLTACSEDPHELGNSTAEGCCAGKQGEAYDACIKDYQFSGSCNVNVPLYGVPSPDPIVPGTNPAIEACCGDFEGASYEACVEDYKAVGSCTINEEPDTYYGPPPVDEAVDADAVEECCGDLDGESYAACVDDYKAMGYCDMNVSLYGVPEPDPEPDDSAAIEACCGDLTGAEYEACVEDYGASGICAGSDEQDPVPTVYGPLPDDGGEDA